MKKLLVLLAVLVFFGANAYAANGDLIVNGNLGVGTVTPSAKLDVAGDFAFMVDGIRLVAKYVNSGEDNFGGASLTGSLSDTCSGNYVGPYTCSPEENNGAGCRDVWAFSGYWWARTVNCRVSVVFTNSEFIP